MEETPKVVRTSEIPKCAFPERSKNDLNTEMCFNESVALIGVQRIANLVDFNKC